MRANINLGLAGRLVIVGIIAVIIGSMFFSMMRYSENVEENQTERITDIIKKAAIQCYALEGSYPPSLGYLVDKYEIILDESRYVYSYNCEAGNMLPDINVIPIVR